MKSFSLLLLPLLADAAVVGQRPEILYKRQLESLASQVVGKPLASTSKKTLKPELFAKTPQALREKVTWGPFKLTAANGTHSASGFVKLDKQSDMIGTLISGHCQECMVLSAEATIEDAKGTRLGLDHGIYVHHVISLDIGRAGVMPPAFAMGCNPLAGFNLSSMASGGGKAAGGHSHGMRRDTTVDEPKSSSPVAPKSTQPASSWASTLGSIFAPPKVSIFVGKGNEAQATLFAAPNTTVKSGYYIGKTDQIYASAEIVNYKTYDREVYLSLDYEYVPGNGKRPEGYMDVGMGAINIDACMNKFDLPDPPKNKSITYTSPDWYVMANGYLINLSPHMHDGAVNMKFFLNDKQVCKSDAIYGGDGGTVIDGKSWETITSYSLCKDPVRIRIGDKLKISSEYDLSRHRLRPMSKDHGMEAEAMALANFQFAIENGSLK
ncbi:hypothetical protein BT63DRAFT_461169 [Microthyrium microscopicum]|uniref:Uncharacterized protein n=1 Tax=Microthyrium microscopicum TaxID=703497 RepID=A0A6A6TUL2_9PEZI|nr:hypothetical protein BT63DRAFT_461169 [Microthyrium microscopicum]